MGHDGPDPSQRTETGLIRRAPDRLASMYFDIRERVAGAVVVLPEEQRQVLVPACPDWSVHELLTHLVSMPMAIVVGDVPDQVMGGGDPNPWLAQLVVEHRDRSITDLVRWWASDDAALAGVLSGAGLLLADLFTHESDLHGAIGSNAHRQTPELDSQIDAALAGLQHDIGEAGLPPIGVDDGHDLRVSGPGEPGWTLRTDFWEAHRALNSRRTRAELLAIDHGGDPVPYLDIMDHHLPLPTQTLGERP